MKKSLCKTMSVWLANLGFATVIMSALIFYLDTKSVVLIQMKNCRVAKLEGNPSFNLYVGFTIELINSGKFDADNLELKISRLSLSSASDLLNWGPTKNSKNISLNHGDHYSIDYFIDLGPNDSKPITDGLNTGSEISFPVAIETCYSTRSIKTFFIKETFKNISYFDVSCYRA